MPPLYDARGEPIAGTATSAEPAQRPRLVPLEPKPVVLDDGSQAVALRDPYGVLGDAALATPAAYWVLAHFAGQDTPLEVRAALERAGVKVQLGEVEGVAAQAAEARLVFGPAYEAR